MGVDGPLRSIGRRPIAAFVQSGVGAIIKRTLAMYHVELLITNHMIIGKEFTTTNTHRGCRTGRGDRSIFVTPKSHRQHPSHSTKQHARTKKKKKKKKREHISNNKYRTVHTPRHKANNYSPKKTHIYICIYIETASILLECS